MAKIELPLGATAKQSSGEIYFQIQAFVETPVKVTVKLNLIILFRKAYGYIIEKVSIDSMKLHGLETQNVYVANLQ